MSKASEISYPALVPELVVSDIAASLRFWCNTLGFGILYDRPDDGFAYLEREGVHVMLEQFDPSGRWNIGAMETPRGQGINFQIYVAALAPILEALEGIGWELFSTLEDKWYRTGDEESGCRQFIVQDPDGYLLRFTEELGTRVIQG